MEESSCDVMSLVIAIAHNLTWGPHQEIAKCEVFWPTLPDYPNSWPLWDLPQGSELKEDLFCQRSNTKTVIFSWFLSPDYCIRIVSPCRCSIFPTFAVAFVAALNHDPLNGRSP